MATLLAIDDESAVLYALRRVFQDTGVVVLTANNGAEGVDLARRTAPDVLLVDLAMPGQSGLEIIQQVRQLNREIPIIIMTGQGTYETAIEAIRQGAFEYLTKPLEHEALRSLVGRALEVSRHMRVPVRVPREVVASGSAALMVGNSPAMQQVYKSIGRVAAQEVTVLILGESGTGKEVVARAIYEHSRRAGQPFLAINCAAIPETLLESELFGHEKGAFTGADRRRFGKFEQCTGGTLFLDEIGDMTPLTQSKVLRVLQEQQFERVGGSETIRTDVRLIAATNRRLGELVRASRFRDDLYYRLNVFTIQLPPLRERNGDLPLLVDHFLGRFSRELGKNVTHATAETLELLQHYPWPGNLRELQSVLKQALLEATGRVLLPDFLPSFIRRERFRPVPDPSVEAADDGWQKLIESGLQGASEDLYADALAAMERTLLTRVLEHTGGNQLQAAKILGITRGCLRTKIRTLGITIAHSVHSHAETADR